MDSFSFRNSSGSLAMFAASLIVTSEQHRPDICSFEQ